MFLFKMFLLFLIFTAVTLDHVSGADSFKFQITKNLETGEDLKKNDWIYIEVTETNSIDSDSSDSVIVDVSIPLHLNLTDILLFFANDSKTILKVILNQNVRGQFFTEPYKIEKEMTGESVTVTTDDKYQRICGIFPRQWLPKNCSKISAAVINTDKHIWNYYEIKNFKISIPDLLLIEEYGNYSPSK